MQLPLLQKHFFLKSHLRKAFLDLGPNRIQIMFLYWSRLQQRQHILTVLLARLPEKQTWNPRKEIWIDLEDCSSSKESEAASKICAAVHIFWFKQLKHVETWAISMSPLPVKAMMCSCCFRQCFQRSESPCSHRVYSWNHLYVLCLENFGMQKYQRGSPNWA